MNYTKKHKEQRGNLIENTTKNISSGQLQDRLKLHAKIRANISDEQKKKIEEKNTSEHREWDGERGTTKKIKKVRVYLTLRTIISRITLQSRRFLTIFSRFDSVSLFFFICFCREESYDGVTEQEGFYRKLSTTRISQVTTTEIQVSAFIIRDVRDKTRRCQFNASRTSSVSEFARLRVAENIAILIFIKLNYISMW